MPLLGVKKVSNSIELHMTLTVSPVYSAHLFNASVSNIDVVGEIKGVQRHGCNTR